RALANEIGLPERLVEQIAYSSMMHDVGKIHIPDYILRKPGRLSQSEFEIMKMHTIFGERILLEKPYYQIARQIARGHHENYDGAGYPDGLKGEDIPLPARIVKLVDIYDALSTKRPYKEAWSELEAFEMILPMRGKQLDSMLVDAFERLWTNGTLKEIKVKYS
ncbi:MAG TPA: HD domain-containing phosphohydrolase, partial [Candidatus Brocadiales bacterium]|nr:HD domain-containing phosphohydrolase [Candidatus Brocadiales bacterium]